MKLVSLSKCCSKSSAKSDIDSDSSQISWLRWCVLRLAFPGNVLLQLGRSHVYSLSAECVRLCVLRWWLAVNARPQPSSTHLKNRGHRSIMKCISNIILQCRKVRWPNIWNWPRFRLRYSGKITTMINRNDETVLHKYKYTRANVPEKHFFCKFNKIETFYEKNIMNENNRQTKFIYLFWIKIKKYILKV